MSRTPYVKNYETWENLPSEVTPCGAEQLQNYDDSIAGIDTDLATVETILGDTTETEIGYVHGVTSLIQTQLDGKIPNSGWISAGETWVFVSVDDPTGVIKIQADVTTKYSNGMRIKMTNGGNTIHSIITKVGTYGGDLAGYTYISFLHEIDPTDNLALYLMANSAITNNFYSSTKAPYGFPLKPSSWTIRTTYSGSNPSKASPSANVWYGGANAWTAGTSVTPIFPIGSWNVYGCASVSVILGSAGYTSVFMTLSSNNNAQDNNFLSYGFVYSTTSGSYFISFYDNITVTSKTTYYLMARTDQVANTLTIQHSGTPIKIIATCAYL